MGKGRVGTDSTHKVKKQLACMYVQYVGMLRMYANGKHTAL